MSLLLLLSFAALVYTYANPGPCSGACGVHDPSLTRRAADGTYFRFSTGNKISYARAPSIQGPWTVEGSALPRGSSINLSGNQDLWAPDVSFVNGSYYLYYAVSTFGSQNSAIGLATSPTMDPNTWTDHGSVDVTSSPGRDYNAIDPNLLVDNGKSYLTFGSFWHDIYQVAMNGAATSAVGGSYNLAFDPSGAHAVEGAFLYKHNNYYYLFYSAGQCCGYATSRPPPGQEYKIKVCRSMVPNGGFVDKNGISCASGGGAIVLQSHDYVYGPGGQGVFHDPALGPVLYYHYFNTNIGYADGQAQFGWNRIDFSSGWPVV